MKGLSKYLAIACLLIPCLASAVQVKDLHLPMTRTEADNTLSKDYDFAVLEDSTVRRQWHSEGRRIVMDFDIMSDQAICIRITYDKPVSKKEAEADVEKLCGKLGGKWSKTKKKAVERIGISAKSLLKQMDGGSLIFLEGDKKKFTRLTYFAKAPKENRWQLQPMSTEERVTAMGSTSMGGSGAAKSLIADEQRRQNTKPTAIASVTPTKPAPSKETKPTGGKTTTSPAVATTTPTTPATRPAQTTPPRKRPAATVVQTSSSEFSSGEVVESIEEIGFIKTSELTDLSDLSTLFDELAEAESFDEKMVIIKEKITPTRAVVGGILLLVILLVLWSLYAKIRNKARARAAYKNILANGPQNGAAATKPSGAKKSEGETDKSDSAK